MNEYEEDLGLAESYIEKRNACAEQMTVLAARLRQHAGHLTFGETYSGTANKLKLRAAELERLAREVQASMLDDIQSQMRLKNDQHTARALELQPSTISRLRSGHLFFGATLIVRVHELTDWPIRDIKSRLKLPCLTSMVTR